MIGLHNPHRIGRSLFMLESRPLAERPTPEAVAEQLGHDEFTATFHATDTREWYATDGDEWVRVPVGVPEDTYPAEG